MVLREASPPRPSPSPSSSFSAAAFQPPWALEAGRGSLSAAELAVVALGRLFFFCYSTLRFLLVSLRVLPGPGGKNLRASVARLGGMPPRTELAREAAERVVSRVLVRKNIFFFPFFLVSTSTSNRSTALFSPLRAFLRFFRALLFRMHVRARARIEI